MTHSRRRLHARPDRLRRRLLPGLLVMALGAALPAQAQTILRIGTGGTGGTYFPIGSLIARAISDMPAGPDCAPAAGTRCGVPGLTAVAQTSNGSVANAAAMQGGEIEMALIQADIASWAFGGTEVFAGKPRHERLRFVAHLYSEAMHVVVRRQANVARIADLRGRILALDEPGSGSLAHVRNLLAAYSIAERDVNALYIKPDLALPRMLQGQLDAFFIVAGWPVPSVAQVLESGHAALLPVDAARAQGLIRRNAFLSYGRIPANTYPGQPEVPTLMVGAQLAVRADLPEDLVAGLLEAMWSRRGTLMLQTGHPRGADIRFEAALTGRTIPLHPGAERFYRQRGLL